MISTLFKAFLSPYFQSWVERSYLQQKINSVRVTQFRLAISEITLGWTLIATMIWGSFLNSHVDLLSPLSLRFEDSPVIFLLWDNRLQGVLLGWSFGFSLALILGRAWVPLFLAQVLMSCGVLAVNVGWGVWMGLLPAVWAHEFLRYPAGRFRRWVGWKILINFIVFVVIFIFSDVFASMIRVNWNVGPVPLHTLQWTVSGLLTLGLSVIMSSVFFHFYCWAFWKEKNGGHGRQS